MGIANLEIVFFKFCVLNFVDCIQHCNRIETNPLSRIADVDTTLFLAGLIHQGEHVFQSVKDRVGLV